AEIRATFFEECAEQLAELDEALAALAGGTADGETVGVAYRAVHSIKGGAASFQMNDLAGFAKSFEALLGEVRAGRAETSGETMALLTACAAALRQLVALAAVTGPLLADLKAAVARTSPEAVEEPAAEEADGLDLGGFDFTPVSVDLSDMLAGGPAKWRIDFAPRPELYANANESARLIREVLALGEGKVTCDARRVPLLAELEPESACLAWSIELTTDAGEAAIREIFEFAEFDCELSLSPVPAEPAGEDGMDIAALIARAKADTAQAA
ncbi:Hpt domain-containing protein, partial [Aureimonas populi]